MKPITPSKQSKNRDKEVSNEIEPEQEEYENWRDKAKPKQSPTAHQRSKLIVMPSTQMRRAKSILNKQVKVV